MDAMICNPTVTAQCRVGPDRPRSIHFPIISIPVYRISKRTLRRPSRTPSISPHGHGLLFLNNIIQVCQRALELPAIDRLGCLAGVFKGNAEVGAAGARGLGGLDLGGCVADLYCRRSSLAGFDGDGEEEGGALCVFCGGGFGWFPGIGTGLVWQQETFVCFLSLIWRRRTYHRDCGVVIDCRWSCFNRLRLMLASV